MNITKIYISGQPCIRKQLLFLLGASPHSQSGCGVGHSNGPWSRGARARTCARAHTHTGSEGSLVCGSRSDWFGVVTYSQMSCGADEQDEPDGAVGGPAGRNVPTEKHAESCFRRGSWFPPNISPMALTEGASAAFLGKTVDCWSCGFWLLSAANLLCLSRPASPDTPHPFSLPVLAHFSIRYLHFT